MAILKRGVGRKLIDMKLPNYGMANGGEWGVDTLWSESFPTCLPLRFASMGSIEVLSYFLDKFRERLSNGAVIDPPH